MVGSGLVLWVVKRRQKAGKDAAQRFMLRLVNGLNVGSVAGTFFWVWGATFVYAFLRLRTAWRDVFALAGVAMALVPIVNVFTTHRHLDVALPAGD